MVVFKEKGNWTEQKNKQTVRMKTHKRVLYILEHVKACNIFP